MSSSDSEDDCYANVASKLQKMKNHYCEDKFETNNILNDSTEVETIVKANSNASSIHSELSLPVVSTPLTPETLTNAELEAILTDTATTSKRVTRASKKKATSQPAVLTEPAAKKTKKRGKKSKNSDDACASSSMEASNVAVQPVVPQATVPPVLTPTRGRRRGRGRGRRGWGWFPRSRNYATLSNLAEALSSMIPTYNIGNTYDYPDECGSQALFSSNTKPSNDVVVIEEEQDPLETNEELSVKVYWQNTDIFKFNIRRFQKLTQIFDYFSKKENVSQSNLLFLFNDKILNPNDTPDSIDYNIAKFIDGGIVNKSIIDLTKNNQEGKIVNGLKIKFQCQSSKRPFEIMIGANDKLSLAMLKCAEHFEVQIEKLKFIFDGDTILGTNTPSELEFEGGECIDVRVLS